MTKQLLSLQTLTRSIIFLVITLLIPTTLWAEDITTYGLTVGGTEVTSANASDILGDGKVSYDNDKHTLTLTNANIDLAKSNNGEMPAESPGIDYQGEVSLIIRLIGENKILSSGGCDVIQCSSPLDIGPSIIFEKGDDNPCSLELEGGSGNIISGFQDISGLSNVGGYGNDLVLVCDKDVNYSKKNGLYFYGSDGTGAPGNPVSSATIATDYHLRIGNVYVTNLNSGNVLLSNTSNNEKVSYNPQTNTLTLNDAKIPQRLFIEQENLTIDLEGTNSITIEDELESPAIMAESCSLTIKSTNKTGNLTLSSSSECSLTQGITPNIIKPLVSSKDIANEGVTMATIHPVCPPIASNTSKTSEGISIYLENDESNGGSGVIKYSIENADKSEGVSNQTFSAETGISMTKPGILTAWIELDSENKSNDLVGKYFGYKQKSIRKVYNGTDIVTFAPEIVPEIEENDNITVAYEMVSGNATVSENAISMSGYGSAMIAARLEQPSSDDNQHTYKLNPDTMQIKVMAVPEMPSIPENNSTFLNTNKIAITSTALSGTTICYKWDNGAENTYSDKIAIEGNTLSAWVKYQPYADAEPVYSDTISATYTIKTDIEGLEFTPSTITDIPYTGSAITPSITISIQEGAILSSSDYTLSFKQVVDNNPATIESAINVGSYILIIEGIGSYGGKKEIPFNIIKAAPDWTADSWKAPEAKSELKYTGEAMDLITAASTPVGTTTKYLTVFSPESYDYVEGANEEWSTTIPTGKVPGNYAVFYKIEGGNNYEDWGPSEVAIKVTIDKGVASITAEDMTSPYTGKPIEFDKDKVEISISTISKDGINFKYYVPNTENPEEPTPLDNAPTNLGKYNVEISLNDENYIAESITATLTITPATMTVTASGYEGAYDGKAHGITVAAPEGATVMYGTKKGNYTQDTSPTYTDAGTHMVHYQVTKSNYTTVIDSAKVEISKADITPTVSLTGWTYGATANEPSITGNTGNGEVTYSYKAEGTETFVETKPVVVGTHTVKATIAETTNYNGAEATNTFTISPATMTVTASGYEGAYDGKAHGITVTAPEGATVMYGTQEGTYDLTASPTFTDAGTYQVYYQVSKENYTPVTGSKTVEISKAAGGLAYSAATASAELNGDGWTAPSLSNPHGLDITYSSSNTAVATVSATGAVSLIGIGQTTIKATSANNINYTDSEAQYVLTVTRGKAKSYGVKIGDTEVNEDNYTDIFGDDGTDDGDHKRVAPSMLFNPEKNTLLIIGSNEGLTIESTLPELNIHLSQDNKLKKVVFNNQGNSANTGKVLFTCDSNFPGKLTIENTEGESAISGFASVGYEFGLQVLAPEDATYKDGKMVNGNGAVVSTLTIGVVLNPLTGDEPDELNPDDFTVTYPDGTTATIDLTNNAINNILYTLNNDTEGQGYDPEYNDIGIVTTMTDEVVTQVANDVANSTLIVGSDDYANRFIGLTFIVQGGEGTIKIAQEVEDGYEFHLKIGNNDAVKVADYIITQPNADVPYQLDDATLCWLYLVKKPGASTRMRSTRVNKRSKLMGSIKHVNIKAKTVASTNSATKVSGGIITVAANNALTDIEDTQVDNQSQSSQHNKWYTLDGRQINKPSQKGLYINNKKKVVIK